MRAALLWLGMMLAIAATAHVSIILALPYVSMANATERMIARSGVNAWSFAPRATPERQAVIRSSPDLAYASCVYDLSDGPVRVRVGPATGMTLLTLYQANTDAFFSLTEQEIGPDGAEIVITRKGAPAPPSAGRVVVSPSVRGLAIERRVAPTEAAFAQADAARRGNLCAPL